MLTHGQQFLRIMVEINFKGLMFSCFPWVTQLFGFRGQYLLKILNYGLSQLVFRDPCVLWVWLIMMVWELSSYSWGQNSALKQSFYTTDRYFSFAKVILERGAYVFSVWNQNVIWMSFRFAHRVFRKNFAAQWVRRQVCGHPNHFISQGMAHKVHGYPLHRPVMVAQQFVYLEALSCYILW